MSESRPSPPWVNMMHTFGYVPDPWQVRVLESGARQILLNCCRQSGKSTVVAALALVEAVWKGGTQVVLISRSLRQARLLFDKVADHFRRLVKTVKGKARASELVLENGSRIVSLPCRDDTIRGYSAVNLLIIDEAAYVPDRVYYSVRPMLAVSQGRLICLSTPNGRRGFFYKEWANGGDRWERVEVPASQVPRIDAAFLAEELRALGEMVFRQEYCCSFEAQEGLVYPDFARCVVSGPAPAGERRVGGIDFGYRNPFAAVWGVIDRDDVLWLTNEHYVAGQSLEYHAQRLPKDVLWYCDPAGAQERVDLVRLHRNVRPGLNAVMAGVMKVKARLDSGRLRVVQGTCPNLLYEATLYRFEDEPGGRSAEAPARGSNHALDALRYLVSRLDQFPRRSSPPILAPPPPEAPAGPAKPPELGPFDPERIRRVLMGG